MARNARQSKILDIISQHELETQEELVELLKSEKFNVTQATISRDIKELGLIKVLSENKKYKYAIATSSVQTISAKSLSILKECVISVKVAINLNVIKVLKGSAGYVSSLIDQLSISQVLGCTYGDDTVLVVSEDVEGAYLVREKICEILEKH